MSFLKPGFGRNGHDPRVADTASVPPPTAPAPTAQATSDAHQRLLGVLAAELDRLEDTYRDAIQEREAKLAHALAEHEALQRRHADLEREYAESQRRVRALKHLLDE